MKLTEFRYERRFNLENYEHEVLTFSYAISEDEEVQLEKVIEEAQVLAVQNSLITKRKETK